MTEFHKIGRGKFGSLAAGQVLENRCSEEGILER